MKKYYMKPTVKVAEINDNILAGSNVTIGSDGDGSEALSKRSSFADDEKPWGSIW